MARGKVKLNQEEFDALDEALREDYVKISDGYLLDYEGVEDVTGLKSALERQKNENKAIKEKFAAQTERIKDLDLEKARGALMTEGKIEELVAKQLEVQKEILMAVHNQRGSVCR